jgi:hypothetical protein
MIIYHVLPRRIENFHVRCEHTYQSLWLHGSWLWKLTTPKSTPDCGKTWYVFMSILGICEVRRASTIYTCFLSSYHKINDELFAVLVFSNVFFRFFCTYEFYSHWHPRVILKVVDPRCYFSIQELQAMFNNLHMRSQLVLFFLVALANLTLLRLCHAV